MIVVNIQYCFDDKELKVKEFIELANNVWPRDYRGDRVSVALSNTINITARDNGKLVGCVRILTDYVFFGTITEILVLPSYQGKGIGKSLMRLVEENTPTNLYFGAQDHAIGFYDKLGYQKGMQSYVIKKK